MSSLHLAQTQPAPTWVLVIVAIFGGLAALAVALAVWMFVSDWWHGR